MFCDEVVVHFTAGKGGDGAVSYRRERYIPKGGPDGGDGGRGGDIILEGNPNLNTLYEFNLKKKFKAVDGVDGSGQKKAGAAGEDLVLEVPLGTKIYDNDTNQLIGDITEEGQTLTIVEGGRGGYGNAHFTSSTRQLPTFAELGEPGEEIDARMELQLIADVAIIGLPSTGKSTLISRVSGARPKIGAYPFTTLVPNLGVVNMSQFGGSNEETFVIADIPGLIEGAHEGKGLGDQFLKHIKRSAGVIHLLDITSTSFVNDYDVIRRELAKYDKATADRKEFLCFNKVDAVSEDDMKAAKEMFLEAYPEFDGEVYFVSAVSGRGLKELMFDVYKWVQSDESRIEEAPEEVVEEDYKVFRPHLDDPKSVIVEDVGLKKAIDPFTDEEYEAKLFEVKGKRIEQIVVMTDFSNKEAIHRVYDVLGKLGVNKELRRLGAEPGDILIIAEKELYYRGE